MSSNISKQERKKLIEIGKKVQQLRKEQGGIGYEKFARTINMNKNTYNRIEKAEGDFSVLKLLKIISYYNISLEEFFRDL